jgi:hypothetical protein
MKTKRYKIKGLRRLALDNGLNPPTLHNILYGYRGASKKAIIKLVSLFPNTTYEMWVTGDRDALVHALGLKKEFY